jgi:hypothetical protein
MPPKLPKVKRRSPDSTEQPPPVRCQEYPIEQSDKQLTSTNKDDMGGHSNDDYRDREIPCNDPVHDTENDPWCTGEENPTDPVSSRR